MGQTVQKISVLARGDFVVTDSGGAPVTGLINTDFTKRLMVDGVNSAIAITVAEVANGRYTATFTPDAQGIWTLYISNATYNPKGWIETFKVTADGVMDSATIANGLLDLAATVDSYTLRQIFRLLAAYGGGKSSGGASDDTIRDAADTKNRIIAALDANGHRTSVTLDLT